MFNFFFICDISSDESWIKIARNACEVYEMDLKKENSAKLCFPIHTWMGAKKSEKIIDTNPLSLSRKSLEFEWRKF